MNVVQMNEKMIPQATSNIMELMADFTVETTPTSAAKMSDFREVLRPGATVYITFLPGSDYRDTIATAKRLREEGFLPAPHFAARSIESEAQFKDYLDQAVSEAIGVAGHPEGSPDMSDEAIAQAVAWKNGFAERSDADVHILTQFCFEAQPIIDWDRQLNAEGNKLPIRIGAPGIAKISTLLNYAMACGIGNSMQFIKKQAKNVTKLMKVTVKLLPIRPVSNRLLILVNPISKGRLIRHLFT